MPDLLLSGVDRDELIDELVDRLVQALRPVICESSEPLLVDGDRMAELAGVSRPTIDRLRADGSIPSILVGRRRLYSPPDVIDALSTRLEAMEQ